ncbi:MAG: deoxyribose-phosphate aldolase [Myxococcota bacterium]|jgi:deoxyribose-phosphate aldolase
MTGQKAHWVADELADLLPHSLREARSICSRWSAVGPGHASVERVRVPSDGGDLAALIDHTILRPDATTADVLACCAEAALNRFATVCTGSGNVSIAARSLEGSGVLPISVVGFPLGSASTASKVAESCAAIYDGAREIDMVMNIGMLKSGAFAGVMTDIAAVVTASRPYPVKVILETCLLTDAEKERACVISRLAGAAYVKSSTGFSTGGATAGDIRLMRRCAGNAMGVKASGGIRSYAAARAMLEAGATRIGSSNSVAIIMEAKANPESQEA